MSRRWSESWAGTSAIFPIPAHIDHQHHQHPARPSFRVASAHDQPGATMPCHPVAKIQMSLRSQAYSEVSSGFIPHLGWGLGPAGPVNFFQLQPWASGSSQGVSIPDYRLQIYWSARQTAEPAEPVRKTCLRVLLSMFLLSELSSIIDFPFLTINVSIPNRKLITLLLNGIWMRHAYVSRASALQNMVGSGSYTSQTMQNSANNSIFLTFQNFTPMLSRFSMFFLYQTSKKWQSSEVDAEGPASGLDHTMGGSHAHLGTLLENCLENMVENVV